MRLWVFLNKKTCIICRFCQVGDRRRIRTFDRLLRRQVLYPAELCDQIIVKHFKVVSYLLLKLSYLGVGVAGFEPATSASQTRRDNRATLHPELIIFKKPLDSSLFNFMFQHYGLLTSALYYESDLHNILNSSD